MCNQLPNPKGRGPFGMQVFTHQRQPRGCGHFHHRSAVRQDGIKGVYLFKIRAFYRYRYFAPAHGGKKRVHAALAAVCHRDADDLGMG